MTRTTQQLKNNERIRLKIKNIRTVLTFVCVTHSSYVHDDDDDSLFKCLSTIYQSDLTFQIE